MRTNGNFLEERNSNVIFSQDFLYSQAHTVEFRAFSPGLIKSPSRESSQKMNLVSDISQCITLRLLDRQETPKKKIFLKCEDSSVEYPEGKLTPTP